MSHHHKITCKRKRIKHVPVSRDLRVMLEAFGYRNDRGDCAQDNGYYSKALDSVVLVTPELTPDRLACIVLRDWSRQFNSMISTSINQRSFFTTLQKQFCNRVSQRQYRPKS